MYILDYEYFFRHDSETRLYLETSQSHRYSFEGAMKLPGRSLRAYLLLKANGKGNKWKESTEKYSIRYMSLITIIECFMRSRKLKKNVDCFLC